MSWGEMTSRSAAADLGGGASKAAEATLPAPLSGFVPSAAQPFTTRYARTFVCM